MSLRAKNIIYQGINDTYVGIVTADLGDDFVDLVYFTGGTMGVAIAKRIRRSDAGGPQTWKMPEP